MTRPAPFADWYIRAPWLWGVYAWSAALHPPIRTLIRGRPWEDCQ